MSRAYNTRVIDDLRQRITVQTRDIYVPDLHIDTLRVKSRNFH